MKIILDTNFLLLPAQLKIDIFSLRSYGTLATLDACIRELEKISKGRGKSAGQAKVGLALIKDRKIKKLKTRQSADKALLAYGKRYSYTIATNDRKLIKILKNNGIRIVRLRQKKYFVVE
jgi:rRNA-processing protein FCF1